MDHHCGFLGYLPNHDKGRVHLIIDGIEKNELTILISALQVGVQVIIAISLVLVMFVIFYAILYQMCKKKRCSRKKDFS